MRVFDFANPDLHVAQRSDTSVPQQALFFMNSSFVHQRARVLAARTEGRNEARAEERVRQLYRAVFQREPSRQQIEWALEFVRSTVLPVPVARKTLPVAWQYGYGAYDEATGRTTNFIALPHFTGEAWQGGLDWPDPILGWVQLTAEGGHAGNDAQHAAIRRWVAPQDARISIHGTVSHEHKPGDGVTARIVSSRAGLLGSWSVHNEKAEATVERTDVRQGDTIDFLTDFRANLNSDMFKWAPVIRLEESSVTAEATEWSAKSEFSGPAPAPAKPLTAWEKYAQVLLLSNEFLFVD
jgi:hypothetical protein